MRTHQGKSVSAEMASAAETPAEAVRRFHREWRAIRRRHRVVFAAAAGFAGEETPGPDRDREADADAEGGAP